VRQRKEKNRKCAGEGGLEREDCPQRGVNEGRTVETLKGK